MNTTKKEIYEKVREDVQAKFYQPIELIQMETVSKSYTGLVIKGTGTNHCSAVANMDALYDMFVKDHITYQEMVLEATQTLAAQTPLFDFASFKSYKATRERLFVRVSKKSERIIRSKILYREIENLEIVETVHIIFENSNNGLSSAAITSDLLNVYGVTEEQLFKDALENSQKLFPAVKVMSLPGPIKSWAFSNANGINGAAILLYPDFLDRVCERMGQNKIIVSATSIHELICSELQESVSIDQHAEALRASNSITDADEVLTDYPWIYDKKTARLTLAYAA